MTADIIMGILLMLVMLGCLFHLAGKRKDCEDHYKGMKCSLIYLPSNTVETLEKEYEV